MVVVEKHPWNLARKDPTPLELVGHQKYMAHEVASTGFMSQTSELKSQPSGEYSCEAHFDLKIGPKVQFLHWLDSHLEFLLPAPPG